MIDLPHQASIRKMDVRPRQMDTLGRFPFENTFVSAMTLKQVYGLYLSISFVSNVCE